MLEQPEARVCDELVSELYGKDDKVCVLLRRVINQISCQLLFSLMLRSRDDTVNALRGSVSRQHRERDLLKSGSEDRGERIAYLRRSSAHPYAVPGVSCISFSPGC